MTRRYVSARDVAAGTGPAHAVRAGSALYTSAIGPVDREGRTIGTDLATQAGQVYRNLDAILREAEVSWTDVVKVQTYVAPGALSETGRRALQEAEARFLPVGGQIGLSVSLPLAVPGWLLAVELIAHPQVSKEPIRAIPEAVTAPGRAVAVRVGQFLYLGAQLPIGPSALTAGTTDHPIRATGEVATQIRTAYGGHDAMLRHLGAGWRDVFKVQQYVTRTDLNMAEMQAARGIYLTLGEFLSTSVVCAPQHPVWPVEDWLLTVDAEVFGGPKELINAPAVWGNPKGPHAIRIGNTVYMHGQVARDLTRTTLHRDDARAQAELAYRNIDGVLAAAGATWNHVAHVKTFCKRREDLAATGKVRAKWLRDGHYAATDLVADFFDPALLVEIEAVTVID